MTADVDHVMRKNGWTTSPIALTSGEVRVLNTLLDALIPLDDSFPSPSSVHVVEHFVANALAEGSPVTPGLMPTEEFLSRIDELEAATSFENGTAVQTLERLEVSDPPFFRHLLILAYHGYYSRPEIIEAIRRASEAGRDYQLTPQPHGYAHVGIGDAWGGRLPRNRGSYTATRDVRRRLA
jgi:hypothetical protein